MAYGWYNSANFIIVRKYDVGRFTAFVLVSSVLIVCGSHFFPHSFFFARAWIDFIKSSHRNAIYHDFDKLMATVKNK